MKSIHKEIILKNLIFITIILLFFIIIISFIIQKKSESQISEQIRFISESKYKSLNKDNLETAFDYNNLIYNTYILDKEGNPLYGSNFIPNDIIKNACKEVNSIENSYDNLGIKKFFITKKNGDLCFVVEANNNNSISLSSFTQNTLAYSFLFLLSTLFLLLKISSRKIQKPILKLTQNGEKILVNKFDQLEEVKTKIIEIDNLNKYFNYLSDLLKQKQNIHLDVLNLQTKNATNQSVKDNALYEADKFKNAIDSAGEIIAILNKDGYIDYINNFAEKYLGLDKGKVNSKKVYELWHKDDDVKDWEINLNKLKTEKKQIEFKAIGKKASNITFESIVNLSPILNKNGEVESILLIERDKSEELQKERLKNEFISVVSHELRTPMTVIRGYTSLLEEEKLGELNTKQKEYLDKISEEVGKLLNLVNDMLDIQKFSAGKVELNLEKTDISEFLKDEISSFTPIYAKKNLYLKIQNESKNPYVAIDKRYFHRVISNLVNNAHKFTEKGGLVIFILEPDEDNLVLAFKDTGVGINENAISHLFNKFYQAQNVLNRKQEGTGLGLSIVKQVIDAHKGMVWVESKEGEGSTFYIALSR